MVESFIEPGNQPIPSDLSKLRYGCSVTDACISWEATVEMLRSARQELKDALPRRKRRG
jgi:3-deoxy-7-phosphoheptulonate synthase